MKQAQTTHRRLHNLGLTGPPFEDAEVAIHHLGAVQSQDHGPAKWSLGQRTGLPDAALNDNFNAGKFLRTHMLRPTWHFVLPEDIRWMQGLTAPRVHALNAYYYRQLELGDGLFKKSDRIITDALKGGRQLVRTELKTRLEGAGITGSGQRIGMILMHAELDALICSGAMRGRQHTYALLEERAPDALSVPPDEALSELTLRYFTSHGPATIKDFKWWCSLTVADIKKGIEMVGPQLQNEEIEGLTYWFVESTSRKQPSPSLHLLQPCDEYIVGYSESKFLLDISRAAPRNDWLFTGVIILDGQVAGQWKRTLKKDSVIIQAALYQPFNAAQTRALERAAEAHGKFLGLTPTLIQSRL